MRIILVEDEIDLGMAVKKALTYENYIVDWLRDGRDALDCLTMRWMEYKLAVIDWMLPGLSGLELCKILRNQGSYLPILMLTARDSMEDKIRGLDAGADDYLVKPFGIEELLARLRALTRRCPQYQPRQVQLGKLILDYGTRTIKTQTSLEVTLTTKEFQLLEYMIRHPKIVLTTDRLRDQLWEIDAEPVSNVVAAQVRLLRKKLALLLPENPIETVYGVGYRFNIDDATG